MAVSNFTFGSFEWFIGIVTNVNDPEKLGRVQVTVFGYNVSTEEQKKVLEEYVESNFDSTLTSKHPESYWAVVMLPTTSAGFGGVGTSHGLKPGSTIIGFFSDGKNAQQPVILGSIGGKSKPVIVPTPSATQIGRPVLKENESSKSQFEKNSYYDLNRLVINEDIDKTIINYRNNNISKNKSAYNVYSFVNTKINPSSLPTSLDNLGSSFDNFGSDISKLLGANVASQISNSFMKKLNPVLNPNAIIDRVLKQNAAQNNAALRSRLHQATSVIGLTECSLMKFSGAILNALELKVADIVAGYMLDMIGGLLPDLNFVADIVNDVENELLLVEANALGIIANTTEAITNSAYFLEGLVTGAISGAIDSIVGDIEMQMSSIMGTLQNSLGDLSNLAELTDQLNALMDISNSITSINSQIEGVLKSGLDALSAPVDAIEGLIDDTIETYESALKELNLDIGKCL